MEGGGDVGANVQWLSVFPQEKEMLYLPLTFLQPTGMSETVTVVWKDKPITTTFIEVNPCFA